LASGCRFSGEDGSVAEFLGSTLGPFAVVLATLTWFSSTRLQKITTYLMVYEIGMIGIFGLIFYRPAVLLKCISF